MSLIRTQILNKVKNLSHKKQEHKAVLINEVLEKLDINENDTVVDCTVGSGGHATEIVNLLGKDGCYLGIDLDSDLLEKSEKRIYPQGKCKTIFVNDNFRNLEAIIRRNKLQPNKILLDLGWNSYQLNSKGFSFDDDTSLEMTYGNPNEYTFTANEIVNHWSEKNIADLLYHYSDEFFSKRIARQIVKQRPIYSSKDLADVISKAVPIRRRIHPATKSFQAIRIAVNDEIGSLKDVLEASEKVLEKGGKAVVICFHGVEEKIVRNKFKELVRTGKWRLLNKNPIKPSKKEILENRRSRSARLRSIERLQ